MPFVERRHHVLPAETQTRPEAAGPADRRGRRTGRSCPDPPGEPCLGRPDSLEEAVKRNECVVLRGGESLQWWMEIEANGAALGDLGGRT